MRFVITLLTVAAVVATVAGDVKTAEALAAMKDEVAKMSPDERDKMQGGMKDTVKVMEAAKEQLVSLECKCRGCVVPLCSRGVMSGTCAPTGSHCRR